MPLHSKEPKTVPVNVLCKGIWKAEKIWILTSQWCLPKRGNLNLQCIDISNFENLNVQWRKRISRNYFLLCDRLCLGRQNPYVSTHPQQGNPSQTKVHAAPKSNLNKWVFYWGLGVTYRSRNNSKSAASPKPTEQSQAHKLGTHRTACGQLSGSERGLSSGSMGLSLFQAAGLTSTFFAAWLVWQWLAAAFTTYILRGGRDLVNLVRFRDLLKLVCIVCFLCSWNFPSRWSVLSRLIS